MIAEQRQSNDWSCDAEAMNRTAQTRGAKAKPATGKQSKGIAPVRTATAKEGAAKAQMRRGLNRTAELRQGEAEIRNGRSIEAKARRSVAKRGQGRAMQGLARAE